ncbi:MAG: cbb3-type cytochrome oxidase maturation protein [Bacteriovoracaceae bacterium]
MEALYILLPLSLILGFSFLFLFIMSVKNGDMDDLDTPAKRILFEDIKKENNKELLNESTD